MTYLSYANAKRPGEKAREGKHLGSDTRVIEHDLRHAGAALVGDRAGQTANVSRRAAAHVISAPQTISKLPSRRRVGIRPRLTYCSMFHRSI